MKKIALPLEPLVAPERRKGVDITGWKCGLLTPVEPVGKRLTCVVWRCRCECGKETLATSSNLLSGNTQSCGCLHKGRLRTRR